MSLRVTVCSPMAQNKLHLQIELMSLNAYYKSQTLSQECSSGVNRLDCSVECQHLGCYSTLTLLRIISWPFSSSVRNLHNRSSTHTFHQHQMDALLANDCEIVTSLMGAPDTYGDHRVQHDEQWCDHCVLVDVTLANVGRPPFGARPAALTRLAS